MTANIFFLSYTCFYRWGCDHEKTACTAYLEEMTSHRDIKIEAAGFSVDINNPFFGASPDGYVKCSCCNTKTLIEVKCPYRCRNQSLEAAVNKKTFCLERSDSGSLALKQDHDYYYQVQGQLHATKADYCDFVVWTPGQKPHIERIQPNPDFISNIMDRVKTFVIEGLLPELLCRWTSRHQNARPEIVAASTQQVWCYCRRPANDDMVRCCYESCDIVFFHLKCTQLRKIPNRKWLCRNCKTSKKAEPSSSR